MFPCGVISHINPSIKIAFLLLLNVLMPAAFFAQQVPDTLFHFSINKPTYLSGEGPEVLIDAAHNNFHTKDGGFYAFAKLLEQDGYEVKSLNSVITTVDRLTNCKIMVIANGLNDYNVGNWVLPTPSAFSAEEISIIKQWVEDGGSLLLIADHMPFAGAAYELGSAFGFEFVNGFAFTGEQSWPPSVFYLKNRTLCESPITVGKNDYEKIDSISTFTGSAFKAPGNAISVLVFLDENQSLQPDTAWRFNNNTPVVQLVGYCQGAILQFGKGRVAVFGEAAMFTAQIVNGNFPVGINSPAAPQNAQFVLNLIHWLDRKQ